MKKINEISRIPRDAPWISGNLLSIGDGLTNTQVLVEYGHSVNPSLGSGSGNPSFSTLSSLAHLNSILTCKSG